jgi:dihydroxyacetone kinase-like protein
MGVAVHELHRARRGTTTFSVGDDEMEVGVGIHGEPGRRRAKLASADVICSELLESIVDDLEPAKGAELLVLVNGLGGTPLGELYLLFNSARRWLERKGLCVARSLIGDVTTSLEMSGASLTLCVLNEEIKRHWDAPVLTPALRWGA